MASVGDIFKKPAAVQASGKRKLEQPNHDPNELYKAAKLGANGDVKNKGKSAAVEDEEDENEFAGPELPPDFEEDAPDDEEGRFFGGGMTKETTQAMEYLDRQDTEEGAAAEKIDTTWVRRLALNFEKRISKNAELRAKFENDPEKFMASEADLDTDIKAVSILSEHPELYGEFSKLGCVASLVSLLSHENTDIAIDAIQTISELIDEDVQAEQEQWDVLVNAMLDADIIELLAQNLSRLDESNDTDRSGVYYILNVLESLASQSSVAEKIGQDANTMPWLVSRIQQKESPVSQNKQYSAEILAIILQSLPKNRKKFAETGGVDTLLLLLSSYRKRDPEKDSDEEEYVENLFDCLTCVVDEEEGKAKFLESEGIELAQIMLREGKLSKQRALRVLDHALSGQAGVAGCERLVEIAGLRTVFGMFMKKQEIETVEHLLGIFSSLLRLLPGGSAPRIRTLAKFMEKDYEKIDKLLSLRREYASRLRPIDASIEQERKELDEEDKELLAGEWLSRRLDAGLFSLQTLDVILAWLSAEDDGARKKISALLADRDEDLSVIRQSLEEQMNGLGEEDEGEKDLKGMLATLVQFV
ncbi:DUF1716 domain protein [Talaromyces proteolyticus]|uniref:DUF1716 domain protein n=1 Tax=Talaromyces proteolyticus TaxID=1131652 RepID=A0AAD4PWG2_9EURO|nr:DUF1716 domain protein [Talaromyces proteolyticus]KAH8692368.1 DUF1716 domain protein [Talaromyces proteolyticus]